MQSRVQPCFTRSVVEQPGAELYCEHGWAGGVKAAFFIEQNNLSMATADNKFLKLLLGLTGCRSRLLHALPAFSGSYCICSCRLNPALTVAQSCTAFLAALCLQALGTQRSASASGELVTCVGNERVKNNLIAGLRSVWTCGLLKENAIQHRCTELFHS